MAGSHLCFLGTGKINVRHLRIVKKLRPGIPLAVASRRLDSAEAFRHRHGLGRAFGSYAEAIASTDVATVVIGTPPSTHASLVELCLEHGKNALIEKPVFNSFDDFERLYPRMRDSSSVMMVAENLHYAPFFRRLKQRLKQSDLGQPIYFDLIRLGRSSPSGWRADPKEMPLGALHEGGVHWIRRLLDLAAVFEDDPRESVIDVSCFGPPVPTIAVPGEATSIVVARHRSGLTSRLLHSWAVPWRSIPAESSKIVCEKGAVYFDGRGIYGRFYGVGRSRTLLPTISDAGGYQAMWKDFLRALEGGGAPDLSLATIFYDFAYMDAAYRSRKSARPEILRLSALR